MVAVAQEGFRYVYARNPEGQVREELFDGGADARERRDVLAEHPEVATRMRNLAIEYLDSPAPPPWDVETPTVELGEMELNQLRALGYAVP